MDGTAGSGFTRRRTLAVLAFGSLGTGLAWRGTAGAQPPVLAWTAKAMTPTQARVADVVAEMIIPTTDTPGARAAGVPQFLDRALAEFYEPADADRIRAGLDDLDAAARRAYGMAFADLPEARRTEVLLRCEADSAKTPGHFFNELRSLVTIAYFTSEPGATKALRFDPVPGDYRGCVPFSEIGRGWAT